VRLVHVTFRFEFTDAVQRILDRHDVTDFVRYAMVEGSDRDGKHFGNQVYPGNMVAVQALVTPGQTEALLEDLRRFREEKPAHGHLCAAVLPIERGV
jgi:hypothetical protein